MPSVDLELEIRAPAARVWQAVVDIERYPDAMENVRWVRTLGWEADAVRRSAWSVTLKGSILEWTEQEDIDHEAMTVRFHQLSGDLEQFDGHWAVEELEPDVTVVRFECSFEIGIPLLAEMLNPVAQRALHGNCVEMLRGIERGAAAA